MINQIGHNKTMPLQLITIPCLSDNYAFLFGNPATGEAVLFDVPQAGPINAAVAQSGWQLKTVVLTHHHSDHIDGLDGLDHRAGLRVIGAKADAHRLPPLDQAVAEGDTLTLCGETAHILDVSGHTLGHIAIHLPDSKYVVTADSLMAMGCGRLFEGKPEQMWASLLKLRALPKDTRVCSGHEYTQSNMRFALSLEQDNPQLILRSQAISRARAAGQPTVPSLLGDECETNPFLRADDPALQKAVGLADQPPATVFAEIRHRKDMF